MQTKEEVYQNAKQIRLGQLKLLPEFEALKSYIYNQWGALLLNGDVFEHAHKSKPMRLRLIFERIGDIELMPKLWNKRLELISSPFRDMLNSTGVDRYSHFNLSDLDVDYFDFENLAFQEIVNGIETNTIVQFFSKEKIWSIQKFWNYITVFYYEDEDVKRYEESGLSLSIKEYIQGQGRVLDVFGVLHQKEIQVQFDSKSNFDRAGGGYNYYR